MGIFPVTCNRAPGNCVFSGLYFAAIPSNVFAFDVPRSAFRVLR